MSAEEYKDYFIQSTITPSLADPKSDLMKGNYLLDNCKLGKTEYVSSEWMLFFFFSF